VIPHFVNKDKFTHLAQLQAIYERFLTTFGMRNLYIHQILPTFVQFAVLEMFLSRNQPNVHLPIYNPRTLSCNSFKICV